MRLYKNTLLATLAFISTASIAAAQDSGALITLLLRKGIITEQEADDVRADLAKDASAASVTTSRGSFLEKVTIGGRVQAQAVALTTDIAGTDADPAAVNHAFLRRIYVGVRAQFLGGWSSYVNYDFAGSTFDAATISWRHSNALMVDVGLRKAPIGYEENFVSSGSLKAIERSPVTRYFVEGNNGRRLGAGSYRQGVFVGGTQGNWSYTFAATNPERDESSAGAAGTGNATNNHVAWWGNVGYAGLFDGGSYKAGASFGLLPDQGGKTLGVGDDLAVYALYGDLTVGQVNLAGEYFWSDNEHGASPLRDSQSSGFWIQPSYRLGLYELVARYTHVDSDGRGITLADGVRSAASGGTMDKLDELFVGANWYLRGNDTKLQAGYVWGQTKDALSGLPAKATTRGVRTQLQVNF